MIHPEASTPQKKQFDHERLDVYQDAILFVAWCETILGRELGRAAVKDQLDRASTSIALNIAEGNGKPPGRDRARYLDIASASALECAACLDVLVAKNRISLAEADQGKALLVRLVSRLIRLSQNSLSRVREEPVPYAGFIEDE